ncbi:DUF1688 family protein [Phenylobacterium kunshanense]|uniref:DUF1688 domain-containing protein n=1 Tax=Phenylobacterium kunshanense TaxID=1445034 RepID=A0A328BMT5_9CAUL|nr:DUF1688 family protein [Phenylobacterium kunshanense]RAK66318.1 DUF1688 domain-containing protein [Phenylobacterium kunshanense]
MTAASDADWLLTAGAVRETARQMLRLALDWQLPEWSVQPDRMHAAADLVADTVRANYPDLNVPFHARWRHFVVGGRDLWAGLETPGDAQARARAAFDLVIPSVLLDAGSGPGWRYRDPETGVELARSEGLGVASFRLFQSGAFSSDPADPLRSDALGRVDAAMIADAFQVCDDNLLAGLEGRAALLRRLGSVVERPGDLFDLIKARAKRDYLAAPTILEVLLQTLGPIWPGRLSLDGRPLGDCWRHPSIDGFVPLHKLSQWMAYSLIEPLEAAGLKIVDLDGLTGLAEYRNGGLFVDTGVIVLRNPDDTRIRHPVDSPTVVAWRSLTVALLDELAPMVRERLGVSKRDFPLARVLEGGTWAAGRRIARQLRADGGPPLAVISDGTVF